MKKLNRSGFTLAELLIVVAIIAVLVAVSVPVFSSQLEKARESTDVANMRAAKAEAMTVYLTADKTANTNVTWDSSDSFAFAAYYDATKGELQTSKPVGYGKGTAAIGGNSELGYSSSSENVGKVIKVTVDANGVISLGWE